MTSLAQDTDATHPGDPARPTSARETFAADGLPWPPVPEPLVSALHPVSEGIFATRALPIGPYAMDAYVGEALAAEAPGDYALVGFDGHGMNSWAVHYYLVQGPLALFVQLPWGGAFADAEADRAEVARVFAWAGRLLARVPKLQASGHWPSGRRLVVASTRFRPSRWAWVRSAAGEAALWQTERELEAAIDQALDALSAA